MQDDVEVSNRLVTLAGEVRALASNGLHWAGNEYDRARYDRLLSVAAEMMAMTDTRTAGEIERVFRGDLEMRSPLVGVDAAVFDREGRILLVQRMDNGLWCMPGGLADVGESAAQAAEREVWEETGLHVEVRRLVGVFDGRVSLGWSTGAMHLYHIAFICERVGGVLTLTNETTAFGYFTEEEAATLPLHRGHAFRIPVAFRVNRGEREAAFQ
jgi:ADP-ribose pyrophosphatase YjhB (NUDIX family)